MKLLLFPFFYLKEILVGSVMVARDSLFPIKHLSPAIVKLDTSMLTIGQRYVLACLISMTPGTLSIGETNDGDTMLVHCLYSSNPEEVRKHLNTNYKDIILKLPL